MTMNNQKKSKTSGTPQKGNKASDKKSKGASKQAPKQEKSGKKPVSYEWQNFTKKSVAFTSAARDLSVYVEEVYGSNISITQYEKFLISYGSMTLEEKHNLHVEKDGVNLAIKYQAAKDARDAERQSFRGNIQVADVQGSLAALASTFSNPARQGGVKRAYDGAGSMEDNETVDQDEGRT